LAEEEPLAQLILDAIRRRRRATLAEILQEIFREPRPEDERRVRDILDRLRITGAAVQVGEHWYDARIFRRLATERPGITFTEARLAQITGIPVEAVRELIPFLIRRRYLTQIAPGVYQTPRRLFRIQKYRSYKTTKHPELYRVEFDKAEKLPRQLVLEGHAPAEVTVEMNEGVFSSIRIVVYTTNPEAWPEERLERIMRALFAQVGLTPELSSGLPYVDTAQAYESAEIEPDEKPEDIDLEEPQILAWISVKRGFTYLYEYRRGPLGWETYRRYKVR
jgi:hypothetical protein